ncbi:ribonuclease J [Acidobacteria bacterium AH-259-D05]|nr:ribonuclease J [Acidobacteria bacterium AH-259-D05]
MSDYLEVTPLGGLGEFGMNCTALCCGDDMILIDAGITFPGSHLGSGLGVDVIVPDISFLKEHQKKLRAILLTHGHEDHAGSVSYVIEEVPVPVYGSRMTLGLVAQKLKERRLESAAELVPIEAREQLEFGSLTVEPLNVTHSFPDSFCFAISTSVGNIIWTGDFKFDQTPVDSKLTDITRLSEYGEKGVLALFSDSTNSEVPGLSPSEFTMYEALGNLFRKAEKKIIVACFASSIPRIQVILDLAREVGRKVAPIGRRMISNIRAAQELGCLHFPPDLVIPAGEAKQFPNDQIVVLATGSQGEPMAALSRMAVNEFKATQVEEGDLVILSARVIPGNEKLISNTINHFYRRGARVYDSRSSHVHTSGHGLQDDLKLMINLTRPQFFIPIHGEFRQLKNHAALAQDQGIPEENILIIENGDSLRLRSRSAQVADKVKVGRRFIDEGILGEVHEVVLRDRRFLSEDGFVVMVLRVDRLTGDLIGKPELISRGFVSTDASSELMEAVQDELSTIVAETPVEEKQDQDLFNEILRKGLKRFLRKQTGKRPIILPVTIEI